MPARQSAISDIVSVSRSHRRFSHVALLASVSALTLFAAAAPAQAGDLLKGNRYASPTMSASAAAAALASIKQAQQATAAARNSLAAATRAIQLMQQNQASWRNLSLSGISTVPNGLGAGGLQVAPNVGTDPTLWQGSKSPVQTSSNGQTTVTIDQTAPKSILTWQSYNVGRDTTVYYNQSGGNQSNGNNNWISLNRIVDPSTSASTILGHIKAEGSVYLINRNGIIFGGSSQVNTHSLIATSLPFLGEPVDLASLATGSAGYDAAVQASNDAFMNKGIAGMGATPILGSQGSLGFSYSLGDVQSFGDVRVEAGAQINIGSLGYALLAAPIVTNAGTIEAPNGQVILAAGMGLALNQTGNTTSLLFPVLTDFLFHTNLVPDATPLFTATNTGLIQATTGNVTLVGGAVNQAGVVEVTTSITRPGSITITAVDEGQGLAMSAARRAGPVTFAPGSVTTILPQEDGETTTSTQAADSSFVPGSASITGGSVTFENGSLLEAPGAAVSVTAIADSAYTHAPSDPSIAGRIFVDDGAVIDVSGLADVELPASAALVTIGAGTGMTANDLADSPLQRDGFLLGQSVVIDSTRTGTRADGEIWVGSPLLDAQGYVDQMPRTIDQMLVKAGTLNLAGGEVITAPGSILNLTGGYVHYLGGKINTTRLLDSAGHVVDIGDADPNDIFVGIADQFIVHHDRWGITETFRTGLQPGGRYVSDYIQGAAGGALNIFAGQTLTPFNPVGSSGATILDGTILAGSEAGRNQVAGGDLPSGGTLSIGDTGLSRLVFPFIASGGSAPTTTQGIVLAGQGTMLAGIDPGFSANTQLKTPGALAQSQIDPDNILYTSTLSAPLLDAAGFSSMSFNATTNLAVEAPLTVQPGGSISLTGGAIEVNADITAPGGSISMLGKGYTISQNATGGDFLGFSGDITIASGVTVSAAGRWVNDTGAGADDLTGSADIDGGSISLATQGGSYQVGSGPNVPTDDLTGSIILQSGSVLDVSSGGYVDTLGQLKESDGIVDGSGGSISLRTYVFGDGAPFGNSGGPNLPTDQPAGGAIVLDGVLRGYGFSGGGTLTLQAPGIQIGGDPATAAPDDLVLPADFFTQHGFGAYNLTALYDATVMAGTTVTVSERNFIPDIAALLQASTGTDLYGNGGALPDGSLVSVGSLDPYHRQATDFALTAGTYRSWSTTNGSNFNVPSYAGVTGTLLVDTGASILADAGASVALTSYNQLTDLGTIVAHGGDISLTGAPARGSPTTGSVWLGADAVLDASGVALVDPFTAPVWTSSGLMVPHTGTILDGGSVSVVDGTGYVVAEAGSRIDVSGTASTFDIVQQVGSLQGASYAATPVWSDAGSITLGGSSGLLFDGSLIAQGGAPQAEGGTLTLSDAQIQGLGGNTTIKASGIILQQSGDLVPQGLQPGQAITGGTFGVERFAVDRLTGSGIDTLIIGADPVALVNTPASSAANTQTNAPLAIGFAGNVNLDLARAFIADGTKYVALAAGATSIPNLADGVTSIGGTTVSIAAPYVDLGGAASGTPVLSRADGTLSVSARTLDLTGQISLQNFGDATFTSTGDIRLYTPDVATTLPTGSLVTAGNLTFQAAQLYPGTANTFIIDAVGPTVAGNQLPTTVTILSNGQSTTPLSAGGSLLLDATDIVQAGTLRAPDGTIVLGVSDATAQADAFNNLPLVVTDSVTLAAGSITSVSLDGITVPYGTTVDGVDWQYQIYNPNNANASFPDLASPPSKSISLGGNALALDPGATVDLSGGGTVQATEWVAGTGGSRNLLLRSNTTYASGATPQQTPLYPDGRAIYAVIPGYKGAVAPVDPEFAPSGAAVGQQVYLSGVPGLPAGIYTLLPAQYATLPGAYRVVQQTGTIDALATQNATLQDGSQIVAGYYLDGLTGGRDSRTTSFLVQSRAAWGQYSQYNVTDADSYFTNLAAQNGSVTPRLPSDAGQLALTATSSLTLGATLETAAGAGGRGATVDIASQDIQIVGTGESAQAGYLALDANDLDALNASSLLIGGTRSFTAAGETIDVAANSVIVSNDASDPLTGPEIILVTKTDPANTDPNAATGLLVKSGSVIEAQGDASATPLAITIGEAADATSNTPGISGDGALLAVSTGGIFQITRNNLPAAAQGLLTIEGGATLAGGKGLTLDAAGNTLVDPGASLSGTAIAADSGLITFIGGNAAANSSGMVIGAGTLAQFAKADQVILRSYGAIDFEGDISVDVANDLSLSAGSFTSGAQGDAGSVSIQAGTLTLGNDLNAAPPTSPVAGSGTLALTADEIDFGTAGSKLASTVGFSGFGAITATARNGIVGQGQGIFDFGALPVTLTAPVIIAGAGGNATLKTTGALVLSAAPAGGATSADQAFGGAITLIGGSIVDSAILQAQAGNVTLEATTGDLTLAAGAVVNAAGVAKQFFDQTAYAPAGNVSLTADAGTIHVAVGAVLNVAGASDAKGGGSAGSLTLSAPQQTVDLQGTLLGGAGADDGAQGGSFTLDVGAGVDLDSLARVLADSGIDHAISIHTRSGNLVLSAGNTITATGVALVADGGSGGFGDATDGNVIIDGTIDASGVAGGQINLFGKSNVDVEGSLLANGTASTEHGGAIQIGTTGIFDPTTGTYDPMYGYESIDPTKSGAIRIGSNAVIDVSGGARGGTLDLRAPILSTGTVNVTIDAAPSQIRGARSVTLEADAVWSTTDATSGAQHFDGIIDPAGWYDANGNLRAGTFTGQDGTTTHYNGANLTAAELSDDLANDFFTPDAGYADHQTFYGYRDGDATAATPGTLMGFIQNGLGTNFASRFAGIANFQAAPGVELDNPSAAINGGNISVLTNWDLGAGTVDAGGIYVPAYRYLGTVAPFLSLRAQNDFEMSASITDGFYVGNEVLPTTPAAPPEATAADAENAYNAALADPNAVGSTISFVTGNTVSFSSVDPNAGIAAPLLTGQAGSYYTNYLDYVTAYNAWVDGYIWTNTVSFGSNFLEPSFLTPPPNPANYPVYASYVADYQAWVGSAYSGQGVPNVLDPQYAGSSYGTYLNDFAAWLGSTFPSMGYTNETPPAPSVPLDPTQYAAYATSMQSNYYTYFGGAFDSAQNSAYVFAPVFPQSIPDTGGGAGPTSAPTGNLPSNMPTATNPLPLQFATLMGGQSTSYRIVAGADFTSTNPLAIEAAAPSGSGGTASGNIALDGHFTWVDPTNTEPVSVPTTLRTGTGSIDLAATGDIDLLDATAPAVIYTGGEPAPGATLVTTAVVVRGSVINGIQVEFLSNGEVHPENAGDITITAGRDIVGTQQVYDTFGDLTGKPGAYAGQSWWQWMETANAADGTGSSINFAAFDQGVMSAGGDVTVTAGRDIRELGVSLPTTWVAAGNTVTTIGGGDLAVAAGRDILSGSYFVARGTGTITAGGEIGPDFTVAGSLNGIQFTTPVSTLLGYQDAAFTVSARQDTDIGGVYDPSYLQNPLTWLPGSRDSQNPTANSALSISSVTGAVRFDTMTGPTAVLQGDTTDGMMLPASLAMTAFDGDIEIDGAGELYPSATGQLTLLADQSINLVNTTVDTNATQRYFGLVDADSSSLPTPLDPVTFNSSGASNNPFLNLLAPGSLGAVLVHSQDPEPVRVYALNGNIVDGMPDGGGFPSNELVLTPNKPAFVQAGHDIVNLSFLGENFYGSDVTRIVAGHDLYDQPIGFGGGDSWLYRLTPALALAGPGYFDIEAGRNIGPLTSANASNQIFAGSAPGTGLGLAANGIVTGIQTIGDLINPALPKESASITILFGIAPGMDDAAFDAAYLAPGASIPGVASLTPELTAYVQQIQQDALTRGGQIGTATPLTTDQAWNLFQALPLYQRQAFIDKAFFTVLSQVGADYNNAASPFFHEYVRGYQAINTLFPASLGYTQNSLDGGLNGAEKLVSTGTFDMRGSTVQTQEGGDVNILGPGGRILVGSVSAPPFLVNDLGQTIVGPNQQGILTMETGNVNIFSDQSLLLAQSRIFTEQGGDMVIWSSNGDINAGEGAKTSSDVPPPEYRMDPDAFFELDAKSEVTGAGIATLQTIPDAAPGNIYLIAPRGTVDAGAAGIRVSGNLNIAALHVVNANNIQVQGTSVGVPTAAAVDTGALTAAGNTAGAASNAANNATKQTGNRTGQEDLPSIITVQVIGYGGSDDDSPVQTPQKEDDKRKKKPQQQSSYDPGAPIRVVGYGALNTSDTQGLTSEEKEKLAQQ